MFPSISHVPSTSTSKIIKRPAAKVLLASRAEVAAIDAGLSGCAGGQEVVRLISSRRSVTKLVLGHNELGNDGCALLFKFLSSPAGGAKHKIAEISLNGNHIGDEGLVAISEYIAGNQDLHELFLQHNSFIGDHFATASFVAAVNSSHLRTLALSTNRHLSDKFITQFLNSLDAPHLRELHISALGLTPKSTPAIISYVSSRRCCLRKLSCNGNSLGLRAVKDLIKAVEQDNFSLTMLEVHSNNLSEERLSETSEDEEYGVDPLKTCDRLLKQVLIRNECFRREVECDSTLLLRCARALLLRPTATDTAASANLFVFTALPPELQLHILSFVAPSLSAPQIGRIYNYASDITTLPPLLPTLSRGNGSGMHLVGNKICIADPSSVPFTAPQSTGGGCANGSCLGAGNSVLCHREKERRRWLGVVGCEVYEPR